MKRHSHSHLVTAALALAASAALLTSAGAQLNVEWITQYGSISGDFGEAITVDALGQSWVSGLTFGNLGGTNAGQADIFLSRLSTGGSLQFTAQRGSDGFDGGYGGVVLVGGSTVFVGGSTSSPTLDGQPAIGSSDAVVVRYDTNGAWQGTTRFGSTSDDFISALAGNTTSLLTAGFTDGSFDGQLNGGRDAFLSKRDGTGALVWTRFAGTNSSDEGRATTFDSAGNGYLAGYTGGSFSGFTNAGNSDLFVARYDAAGTRTLLRQIGTNGIEIGHDVKVDVSGNIYLTGSTSGALGGEINAGDSDAFLMKLDSNGNVLWTRLLGGASHEQSIALGLDEMGRVWIGGQSSSSFGGHTNAGGTDAFVALYDGDGLLLDTEFFATSGDDSIQGLAIGPDRGAYVTGRTNGALGDPNFDVFVAKLVPEPSAALLLGGAGLGLLLRRRR